MKVVDGDTVEVRVHVWLGQEVITGLRLLGIDVPEIAGACGPERSQAIAARNRLAALMGDGPVTLGDLRPDKYFGRVVGRVLTGAGDDAGAMLVREGLAWPYSGGTRQAAGVVRAARLILRRRRRLPPPWPASTTKSGGAHGPV